MAGRRGILRATCNNPVKMSQLGPLSSVTKQSVRLEKLVKWLIFSVVLALIPILVAYLGQITRGVLPPWHETFGRGELLLIAAAMCATSSGELFTASGSSRLGKLLAGGAAIVLLLVSASYFAEVSSSMRSQAAIDTLVVAQLSLFLYACSFLSSAGCVYLSESE
jgi:hypothetical protein